MVVHIVGNRPQFIKLAPLYHELDKRGYSQHIVHTGQHYDANLSDIFFEELDIPRPHVNLAIGSGTHATMTAKAMIGIEDYLNNNRPKVVILYGDTDSTVAAALAAKKLDIPIAHVEGGARTGNRHNPEENNRIVTDHLSDIIFCPDLDSVRHAKEEGLAEISFYTGDIMYDTYLEVSAKINKVNDEDIILMTWHRQENTDSKQRMEAILNMLEKLPGRIVCPMHPRTISCLKKYDLWDKANSIENFQIIEPVGYYEMVSLMNRSKLILTDSGGLSKESSFCGVKCLFMVDIDAWPELRQIGWLRHINPEDTESVSMAINEANTACKFSVEDRPALFGNGDARIIISDLLEKKGFI